MSSSLRDHLTKIRSGRSKELTRQVGLFIFTGKKNCISNIGNMFKISQATGELTCIAILGQYDYIFSKIDAVLTWFRQRLKKGLSYLVRCKLENFNKNMLSWLT